MRRILKETKGITLIALVLTIVVLLILAGVTIATLTGENGILSQAQVSKDSTERAEEKERIQLEVLASYETDGILSISNLKSNISAHIEGVIHDNANNFPLIVTYTATGHAYKVESDGTVSKNIGLSMDKEEITFIVVNGVVQSPTTEKITATLQGITGTVNWTSDDENEEVISLSIDENEVTVTANGIGNAKVTASLEGEEPVTCNIIVKELQTVTINTAVSPANTGTAQINEEEPYIKGNTVTIIPTANAGYTFEKWTDESNNEYIIGGNYVGITIGENGELEYEITETTAKTFTATFKSESYLGCYIKKEDLYGIILVDSLTSKSTEGILGKPTSGFGISSGSEPFKTYTKSVAKINPNGSMFGENYEVLVSDSTGRDRFLVLKLTDETTNKGCTWTAACKKGVQGTDAWFLPSKFQWQWLGVGLSEITENFTCGKYGFKGSYWSSTASTKTQGSGQVAELGLGSFSNLYDNNGDIVWHAYQYLVHARLCATF